MRSKRTPSSNNNNNNTTNSINDKDGASSAAPTSASNALSKRAADMLANTDLSTFGEPKPDSQTLAEIREGSERLASELEQYLANHETDADNNNASLPFTGPSRLKQKDIAASTLSDEAIADLQLATARKLREVRVVHLILGTVLTIERRKR
jgi:hypothetical protein